MPIHTPFVVERPYAEIELGESASISKMISEADIVNFAGIIGDFNPVHVNPEYAKTTMFGERIAHGMLTASFISTLVGCCLPGVNALYLSQEVKFVRPVKIGDTLTVRLEILEKLPKFRVRIATRVFNQRDELVVDGEAEILAPRKQQTVTLPTLPAISIG